MPLSNDYLTQASEELQEYRKMLNLLDFSRVCLSPEGLEPTVCLDVQPHLQ